MIHQQIKTIEQMIPKALGPDRMAVRRALKRVRSELAAGKAPEAIAARLQGLAERMSRSVEARKKRVDRVPALTFPPELPITTRREEITAAIRAHRVIIVSGDTGSGKTTQIPKYCLAAGRGIDGVIGCTQPRRIAATTVARRIAEELGEAPGRSVGHKIRFQDRTATNGFIKIMTDGVLLAETQTDPLLSAYDTIIVDEAHERSLNIDFILGLLRKLLLRRRDLHLIITSATIDTEKFSAAFDNAPVIEVSGRMYPVEIRYMPVAPAEDDDDEPSHVEMAARAVDELQKKGPFGDVLIFMPTEQGIRETGELIEARQYPGLIVLPLFARLSAARQARVFAPAAGRKVIIATNIAETSITIPGIRYVIDTGLARISSYNPRSRTTALPVTEISKSSADQRKGRCGRVADGVCIRLYTEESYEARPLFTLPEILRANLAEVILRMISLGLGDVSAFPFIDRPADRSVRDGFDLLLEIGAITPRPAAGKKKKKDRGTGRFVLTGQGRLMAKIPVDPRLSRMLIEARRLGCVGEMTVIAAALCIADPRERPQEKAQAADAAQQVFRDPASDFVTRLNIWRHYHQALAREKTTARMKAFCTRHFLSFRRMREWRDIHNQLHDILKENRFGTDTASTAETVLKSEDNNFSALYEAIHRSLLSGFLSNIAMKKENALFQATQGRQAMVFPGSALFKHPPAWIVAAEMVETSRLFARTCAAVDPAWIEAAGRGLCRSSYADPHWEKKRGEVVAAEQVSLFGLILVAGRSVPYGPIDPREASDIFIRSALVEDDIKIRFDFITHNRRLVSAIQAVEDRIRRRDILVTEEEIFDFYRRRLDPISDERTLGTWIKKQGGDGRLRMTRDDLIRQTPDPDELSRFPKQIHIDGQRFACDYRFEPEDPADGITIRIPAARAAAVTAEATQWLVPGLLREKITALVRALPKTYRKRLVPVSDTVETVMADMPRTHASLITALGQFLHERYGVHIPATAWSEQDLPDHLRARLALVGPDGEEIRSSRDPSILKTGTHARVAPDLLSGLCSQWERTDITGWDFGDLPDSIPLRGRCNGSVFPALSVEAGVVCLRLFQEVSAAKKAHGKGVAALLARQMSRDLTFLKRSLKLPAQAAPWARTFGGAACLEAQCFQRLVDTRLKKDIRTPAAFDALAAEAGARLMADGQALLEAVLGLLQTCHETMAELGRIARQHMDRAPLTAFVEARQADLDRLVPKNFIDLYDPTSMAHIVRYVRAMALRTHRGIVDLEKDRVKAETVQPFAEALQQMLGDLTAGTSPEKRRAVEDFFWLLEEFKVSVFAQELKTAVPVSRKRLEARLGEIGRMV
ncbi:MAG: ATP-dependent RNA helicase HrpA [Desulfobacterales bacterium]|nr:ATP-dependent RNA helicase HrpA [Desulfobacterales bacterium]